MPPKKEGQQVLANRPEFLGAAAAGQIWEHEKKGVRLTKQVSERVVLQRS
jgi:hypothetical protein